MAEDRDKWRTFMVCPTLGSRTAEERNRKQRSGTYVLLHVIPAGLNCFVVVVVGNSVVQTVAQYVAHLSAHCTAIYAAVRTIKHMFCKVR